MLNSFPLLPRSIRAIVCVRAARRFGKHELRFSVPMLEARSDPTHIRPVETLKTRSPIVKMVLGIVFAVLALLWTGGAAAVAQLVEWSAQGLAAGGSASTGTVVTAAAAPSWLSAWIDPATWSAAQQAITGALAAVSASLPAIGTAVGWLVPAVWVGWGLGLVALMALTLVAYLLIARVGGGGTPGPAAA
jgi:hypothetical protein